MLYAYIGLYADTSKDIDGEPLDTIDQNYVMPFQISLENISKKIVINKKEYEIRGIIAFSPPKRGNLRSYSYGHYTTYSYRSNGRWELYDDCSEKVVYVNQQRVVNIDLLVFTI